MSVIVSLALWAAVPLAWVVLSLGAWVFLPLWVLWWVAAMLLAWAWALASLQAAAYPLPAALPWVEVLPWAVVLPWERALLHQPKKKSPAGRPRFPPLAERMPSARGLRLPR